MSYDTHCSSCGMPYSDFAREGAKSCECHKMAAQAVRDFVFDKPALSAAPVAQEPVAYQYRACIAGKWGDWTDLHQSVEGFRNGPWKFGLENGTCELRALYAGTPPATPAGMGCDYPSCGCDFDSICRTRMAILSGGGPDAKPDGYRFRHKYSNREWEWSNEKPEGPSIHLFDVEACYTRPIRSAGVGADEIAQIIATKCFDPRVIDSSGKPFWKKSQWREAQQAANAILALLSRAGDQSNSTQKDGSR